MTKKPLVSVVIGTYRRNEALIACLTSIYAGTFQDFEVLVMDQGERKPDRLLTHLFDKRVRHFTLTHKGVSKAKNLGIAKAEAGIIALTDDDCIASRDWLASIYTTVGDNDVVFGRVLPYKPEKHDGMICPSIVLGDKKRLIQQPVRHWQSLGLGNNLAADRQVFLDMGGFEEWLGPGSVGSNGEDGEWALRQLVKSKPIRYDPAILVYHDKWLTPMEWRRQRWSYVSGEMACYGRYMWESDLAFIVVSEGWLDSQQQFKAAVKKVLKRERNAWQQLGNVLVEIGWRVKGWLVGQSVFVKNRLVKEKQFYLSK